MDGFINIPSLEIQKTKKIQEELTQGKQICIGCCDQSTHATYGIFCPSCQSNAWFTWRASSF